MLKIFQVEELVLAEKGFLISDLMPPGTSLNIPPFLMTPQFNSSKIINTKSIVGARIHVERVMVRLKRLKILSHITKSSLVFKLCATLVNFQNPIIKDVQPNTNNIQVNIN